MITTLTYWHNRQNLRDVCFIGVCSRFSSPIFILASSPTGKQLLISQQGTL